MLMPNKCGGGVGDWQLLPSPWGHGLATGVARNALERRTCDWKGEVSGARGGTGDRTVVNFMAGREGAA